jgi:hypothetical protein
MTKRQLAGFALALALAACRRSEDRTAAAVVDPTGRPPSWVAVHLDLRDHDAGAAGHAAVVIEQAVMRVPELATIRTEITEAQLVTWLAFDADDATSSVFAVRDALTPALNALPIGAHPEVIRHDRGHAGAWILLRSQDAPLDAITEVADGLRKALLHQPGVVDVSSCGPRKRTVVALDDARMAALGLTAGQVLQLLQDSRSTLAASSIDVEELRTRKYADIPGDAFMTIGEERTGPCRVLTGNRGLGVALHVRYWADADRKAALTGVLGQTSAELPAGIALEHEALTDRVDTFLPRVHVRLPNASAFPDAIASPDDGGWVVFTEASASGQLVGLADAEAARRTAARWSERPGITAAVQDSRWSTVAIGCQDPTRLRELSTLLAASLGRGGRFTPWPEVATGLARSDVAVDREHAARAGVAEYEIRETIALYREGVVIGELEDAPFVDVVVRAGSGREAEPPWTEARVRARDGAVRLSDLLTLREVPSSHQQRCNSLPCVGFAIPAAAAAELDLAAMTRELALTTSETLQVLPRPP